MAKVGNPIIPQPLAERLRAEAPAAKTDGHASISPSPEKKGRPPVPKPKPDPVVSAASLPELAREEGLIGAIRRDLATVGLVGESDAGLFLYLAYSSRKLNKPLSVIIRGPSGSGKDEIQRRPAELMPPGDVLDFMSLTPQRLYYGEPGSLKHKVLVGGERSHQDDDAQRDRTAAVRQLLTHGYLSKGTVGERLKGQDIHQEGPVSYSETTTKASIFKEDLSRCVQIYTDAGPELTARVLEAQAREYLPTRKADSPADRAKVRERHHAFQRSLEYVDVRIAYADVLAAAMPRERLESRRVFRQLLVLIEVIAFLHQHQRDRNADGELEATVADYAVARRLALGPLHAALGLSGEDERLAAFVGKLPAGQFTSTAAGKWLDANSRKVLGDWLGRLADASLIRQVKPGAGNQAAVWEKTGKDVSELLLPPVAAIRAAVGG
jgi:hypothetical protein